MPRRTSRYIALCLVLLGSACGNNGLDSANGSKKSSTPATPETLKWTPCEDDTRAQCSKLSVPLDWSSPNGKKITLALARIPATDPDHRIGAVLTNPGGPGGSGIEFVRSSPFNSAVAERFDQVSWDPRGVGKSTAFRCDEHVADFLAHDPDPDNENEQSQLNKAAKSVADDCKARDADLSAHVGTDNVARDLEAIRVALGEPKLTYMGFSYGTLIGLRYLALFPTHVRAMVLDGVVDPTLNFTEWLSQQTVAIDASLTRAFASCGEESTCPVDDAAAAFDEVKRRVEVRPIPGKNGELGPAALETAAVYASYDRDLWPNLASALSDALDGDGTAMLDLASSYYDFGGYPAYAAVECLDSPHPTGVAEYEVFADELQKLSPRFGGSTANELLPCAFWPAPPQPIQGAVTAKGSPPVLVLGNRGDAATPYANSVHVADALADGHLVSFDGEGHTSYGRSTCVDRPTDDYLVRLVVPKSDPDCGR